MSHFAIMVIGENVAEQLQPFHEFECTGTDDQYVQDQDNTEEYRQEYEEATTSRLRDAEGNLHSPYDDRFYRDPTPEEQAKIGPLGGTGGGGGISWHSKDWGDGRGYRPKVKFRPEGLEQVEVPKRELQTFAEYVEQEHGCKPLRPGEERGEEHRYGFAELDAAGEVVRAVRRTNPEAKWDYWRVGGRYTGRLKLREKALGSVGPTPWERKDDPAAPGYADSALKGDVDWEQMRADAAAKARALWRATREITGGQGWDSFSDMQLRFPEIEDARREYWEQPALVLLKASGNHLYSWDVEDDLALDEDRYVELRSAGACSFFAYLKDGQWCERGEMGWFASVSNEMSVGQWHARFNAMLDSLPPDTRVTIVDCHI